MCDTIRWALTVSASSHTTSLLDQPPLTQPPLTPASPTSLA
ncbi:hypothetical protein Pmani_031285, partial [Petrolisthes manimaculis]